MEGRGTLPEKWAFHKEAAQFRKKQVGRHMQSQYTKDTQRKMTVTLKPYMGRKKKV